MKKNLILFLFLLACITVFLVTVPVSAADANGTCGANLTWNFDEETGTLTVSGSGDMDAGEHPVWNDLGCKTTILVIEEGITSISHGAFMHFSTLKNVTLPNSLRIIQESAFNGCSQLESITLGDQLTKIGKYAFNRCSSLKEVIIPEGVTQVEYGAFSDCYQLSNVVLHSGITLIDGYAFSSCNALTTITIPDSVKTIKGSAFSSCRNLSKITLSSSLTYLGGNVFSNCTSLTELTIPDGVEEIRTYTFSGCKALCKLTLGAGVKQIKSTAIWGCTALSGFTVSKDNPWLYADQGVLYTKDKQQFLLMPQGFSGDYQVLPGTTEICSYAATECTKLTGVHIPGSVKSIGEYAFDWCTGLIRVTLSEGITTLNLRSFFQCHSLPEITFPSSLSIIKQGAFEGGLSLKKITFLGMAPKIQEHAFSDVTATAYYIATKPGWKESTLSYGGDLTWVAISCNGNHTVETYSGKAATCTQAGLTDGSYCSVCGEVLCKQEPIPATGHSYGAWTQVIAATTETPGLSRRMCKLCGAEEQKTLPMLESTIEDPTPSRPAEPEQTVTTAPEVTQPSTTVPEETQQPPSVPENTQTATIPENPTSSTSFSPVPEQEPNETQKAPSDLHVGKLIAIMAILLASSGMVVGSLGSKRKRK